MKIRFGLAVAVLALAGAAQAHAAVNAEGDVALAEVLNHVPRDADGKVSRETFVAYMENAFDRADTNKAVRSIRPRSSAPRHASACTARMCPALR
jgi:hypothetical protein